MFTHESETARGMQFQLFYKKTERVIKVTGSHAHRKCGYISEFPKRCQMETLLLHTTNSKSYMAIPMTLSHLMVIHLLQGFLSGIFFSYN